jgi:ABC-type lipoprotein release transport system permease subunit
MLHGTNPVDPVVYAIAGAPITVVALVASRLPVRRAGRVEPARALRAS